MPEENKSQQVSQPTQPVQNEIELKKQWSTTWWGVLIIILFLPFFAIWYVWAKTKWSNIVKLAITVPIAILILLVMFSDSDSTTQKTNETTPQVQSTTEAQKELSPEEKAAQEAKEAARLAEEEKYKLTLTKYKEAHNKRVENFMFVMTGTPKDDNAIIELTKTAKKDNCTRDCNVLIYDTEKAAELDYVNSFTSEIDGTKYQQWMKDNYVYLADHTVSMITFDNGQVELYPYRSDPDYDRYKSN